MSLYKINYRMVRLSIIVLTNILPFSVPPNITKLFTQKNTYYISLKHRWTTNNITALIDKNCTEAFLHTRETFTDSEWPSCCIYIHSLLHDIGKLLSYVTVQHLASANRNLKDNRHCACTWQHKKANERQRFSKEQEGNTLLSQFLECPMRNEFGYELKP